MGGVGVVLFTSVRFLSFWHICIFLFISLFFVARSFFQSFCTLCLSDGGSEVCPAMAHLLSLVPTVVVECLAPRIVSDTSTTDAALLATLTRLTAWLVAWPTAHTTLGLWVRTLVRLLYQSGRIIIPARVTLDRVPRVRQASACSILCLTVIKR